MATPAVNAKEYSRLSLAAFVANRFIPEHVDLKSFAGRQHYQSMLKHILRPETVDMLFHRDFKDSRTRMKAIPGWPYLDDVDVSHLAEEHMHALTVSALAEGYSPQTVKHIRTVLGTVISHTRRKGPFAGKNSFAVDVPPVDSKRRHKLTISEAKSILRVMQYPEREIALITITAGMTIQEICGMQWKHLNLTAFPIPWEDKTIPPGHILVKQHWNPMGIVSLSANRTRLVELSKPLSRVLQILKNESPFSKADHYVLSTPAGAPIRPSSLRILRLKPIGRSLGMPWLSWQVLKGAHETLLSELRLQLSTDLIVSARI